MIGGDWNRAGGIDNVSLPVRFRATDTGRQSSSIGVDRDRIQSVRQCGAWSPLWKSNPTMDEYWDSMIWMHQ
jgi:hypothetical protein